MSRIGKKAITLPDKVKVKLDGQKISVDGPKGSLSRILPSLVCCTFSEDEKALLIDIPKCIYDTVGYPQKSLLCLLSLLHLKKRRY